MSVRGAETAGEPATFRVLTVCTGNICRSPATELRLRAGLGEGVTIESAGTQPQVGLPVDPPVAELLEHDGVDTAGFRSRRLTEEMIRSADLVLALSREHRAVIVDTVPAAVRRTFTLREFAAIAQKLSRKPALDGTAPEVLAVFTQEAPYERSAIALAPEDRDVPDPYGGDAAAYETANALIRDATDAIVESVRGEVGRGASRYPESR